MPLLSDTMKEGKIVQWHKNVGDTVKSDDILADVETDKATMEIMPYVDGVLLHIGIPTGSAAVVNEIIAIIGKNGEDISSLLNDKKNTVEIKANAVEEKVETISTETKPTPANVEIPKDISIIRMPLLSDTMKEGKIISWLKNVGDVVKSDDILAEVETDKATMEVMGYADGTLLYQGVEAGKAAKINDVIAIVGKKETDINLFLPQLLAETTITEIKIETAPETKQAIVETPKEIISETNNSSRIFVSPLAKKIAEEKGIELKNIKGSGDGGRIIKRDLENANSISQPKINLASQVESYTDIPNSQMRQIIAQRLSESKLSAPHFYLKMTIEMDNLLSARKQINQESATKISINDMMIKAVAMALAKNPAVNSSWMGDKIRQHHHIHIGSAVAIEDGLIVPVIKFANIKSLEEIAQDANQLYEKAKTKKIQPHEFTGNTFTISNLGMMDIDEFTAIVNPPDACILAVGKITPTPVVLNDKIEIRQLLKLTLSCDHRVVDGAVGAKFLQTLKSYLEQPILMFI